jgi:hypothetical protein
MSQRPRPAYMLSLSSIELHTDSTHRSAFPCRMQFSPVAITMLLAMVMVMVMMMGLD